MAGDAAVVRAAGRRGDRTEGELAEMLINCSKAPPSRRRSCSRVRCSPTVGGRWGQPASTHRSAGNAVADLLFGGRQLNLFVAGASLLRVRAGVLGGGGCGGDEEVLHARCLMLVVPMFCRQKIAACSRRPRGATGVAGPHRRVPRGAGACKRDCAPGYCAAPRGSTPPLHSHSIVVVVAQARPGPSLHPPPSNGCPPAVRRLCRFARNPAAAAFSVATLPLPAPWRPQQDQWCHHFDHLHHHQQLLCFCWRSL